MGFRQRKLSGLEFAAISISVAFLLIVIGVYNTPLSLPLVDWGDSEQISKTSVQDKKLGTDSSERQQISPNKRERERYGHLAYAPADPERMILVASYATGRYQRFESMYPDAAKALMRMIYAARDDGAWIVPVSGFRTWERQNELFQEQVERLGSKQEAAKVSAPPGYSEHHTGFAIDLTDGRYPKKDITDYFEKTEAYKWLTQNAEDFGFELSFSRNNEQGISFEPWHWRYVGTTEAKRTFAKSR